MKILDIFKRGKKPEDDLKTAIEPEPRSTVTAPKPDKIWQKAIENGWTKATVVRNAEAEDYKLSETIPALMEPEAEFKHPHDKIQIIYRKASGDVATTPVLRLQVETPFGENESPFEVDEEEGYGDTLIRTTAPQFSKGSVVETVAVTDSIDIPPGAGYVAAKEAAANEERSKFTPDKSILNGTMKPKPNYAPLSLHNKPDRKRDDDKIKPEKKMKTIKDMVNPDFLSALPKTEIPEFDDVTIGEISSRIDNELADLAEEKKWIKSRLEEMAKAKKFFNDRTKQIEALELAYEKVEKAADAVEDLVDGEDDEKEDSKKRDTVWANETDKK